MKKHNKAALSLLVLATAFSGCDKSTSESAPQVKVSQNPVEETNDEVQAEPSKKVGRIGGNAKAEGKISNKESRRRTTKKRMKPSGGIIIENDSVARGRMPMERPVKKPIEKTKQNTEGYKDHGVNPLTKTADDKFSTFSVDVDTASYAISRKKLNAGIMPPPASVRVEEFVNYFKYDYPEPEEGAFAVHLEGAPSPFVANGGDYIMRVGVQGKRLKVKDRKPVHLTFLVDVSGSMSAHDKLPLAQTALHILVSNLNKGDSIALSTYAGHTAEILAPTGVENRKKIKNAIDNLKSGGGTGMSSGMESAYKSAMKNFQKKHVNRVIILSDGDANIGPKSHKEILSRIKHFADEGVTLSTIGLGMGNYKDTMMEQLANKGNGNYYYIDTAKEAKKVFGEQLDGTLQVIAKDVKIQVEFDPKKVESYRLIGYENRKIADEDFRNDRVDAGEIGAGHSVTALYSLKLIKQATGKLATVRIRAKKPDGQKASELAFDLDRSAIRDTLASASKDFQFQMGVVEFAEVLRKSPYAEGLTLALVQEIIAPVLDGKEDRVEFSNLLKKAMSLK